MPKNEMTKEKKYGLMLEGLETRIKENLHRYEKVRRREAQDNLAANSCYSNIDYEINVALQMCMIGLLEYLKDLCLSYDVECNFKKIKYEEERENK
jgi:hypothetical protein